MQIGESNGKKKLVLGIFENQDYVQYKEIVLFLYFIFILCMY